MSQQAFYRDTAIGEFQLDANGFLAYRSWGQRKRTLAAIEHGVRHTPATSRDFADKALAQLEQKIVDIAIINSDYDRLFKSDEPWRLEGLEAFFDDSVIKNYKRQVLPENKGLEGHER